jgi:hypothetical protein
LLGHLVYRKWQIERIVNKYSDPCDKTTIKLCISHLDIQRELP